MSVTSIFHVTIITCLATFSRQIYAQQIAVETGINRADYVIGFFNPNKNSISEINYGTPDIGIKVGATYKMPIWRMVDVDAGLFYAQRS